MAGLCRRHTEELEELLPSQIFSSCDGSNSLERIQREEPVLSDIQDCGAAAGDEQRILGSTQVNGIERAQMGVVAFVEWIMSH